MEVKINVCENCKKTTDCTGSRCFHCLARDYEGEKTLIECWKCKDWAGGIDDECKPMCFDCYWSQKNEEFQKSVAQGR